MNKTLYLREQGSIVTLKSKRFLIKKEQETLGKVLLKDIHQITVFGNIVFTPQALNAAMDNNIPVTFFTVYGNYRGSLNTQGVQTYQLQEKQLLLNGNRGLKFVKQLLPAMVASRLYLLRQYKSEKLDEQQSKLQKTLVQLKTANTLASIRGYEGNAAKTYFECFGVMLKDYTFPKRTRRPPQDIPNALLSLGYSMLRKEIEVPVRYYGLNPYKGYLHKERYGRPSLVLDLMEQFRPVIEQFTLRTLNLKILKPQDFEKRNIGVYLKEEALKRYLQEYDTWTQKEYLHPVLKKNFILSELFNLQVRLLTKYLLEELDIYPAFWIIRRR